MATVHLAYTVPVIVEVDTETREVCRVVVCDEEVKRDLAGDYVGDPDIQDLEIKIAVNVAESDDWPGWTFGW